MSKYSTLGDFLRKQPAARVLLTFAKIEQVIGGRLPRSARYSAWWSNNPSNNAMTKVWLEAGFRSEQVDVPGRKVVFRKVDAGFDVKGPSEKGDTGQAVRHPLFGALKGLIRIPPGVDLTEPADPEWGKGD